jgi:Homeodomain-like domain
MTEHVTLSRTELDRVEMMTRLAERRLTQRHAGELLGVTERQVRRLYRAFKSRGAAGLVSAQRGQPSHRRLPADTQRRALELIRERYADFGPTLAREKLTEAHDLVLSVETVRGWMIAAGIWLPRAQRTRRSYPPRERRPCLGELVQIDGSAHAWFEDRGPVCTLLVYVDDATSRLMELRFADSESTFDYFAATRSYLERHGKPVAFYSDRLSVFRATRDQALGGRGVSQFGRAMTTLNIDIICANSPQAKGRVERSNLTLQDRLVKELRLRGISDRTAGQAYLPEFREDYNRRFAKPARHAYDAHRSLPDLACLDEAFTLQEERRVSKNLTLAHQRILYVLEDTAENRRLRGHQVTVHEHEDGRITIRHAGRPLVYRAHPKDTARITQGAIVEHKRLAAALTRIATQQRERDLVRLAHPNLTLRAKKRIRTTAGTTALAHPPE